eukprot:7386423-Prymnesium_polylepis.1
MAARDPGISNFRLPPLVEMPNPGRVRVRHARDGDRAPAVRKPTRSGDCDCVNNMVSEKTSTHA